MLRATAPHGQQLIAIGKLGDAVQTGSKKQRIVAALVLMVIAVPVLLVLADLGRSLLGCEPTGRPQTVLISTGQCTIVGFVDGSGHGADVRDDG